VTYNVGCVPYLNAKPLVKPLEWWGAASPVKVTYAVPSELPFLLSEGHAQAIMVSSIHALTSPGSRVAGGLSISTRGEVLSVRLFSKVPFDRIETLALDMSSMTSNALARILLAEQYGARPSSEPMLPGLEPMLRGHDACVLIGDNGMAADPCGAQVLDLGLAWETLTGLPFTWALWVGDEGLTQELSGHLARALEASRADWEQVIRDSIDETGFTESQCRHYLGDIMEYALTDAHLQGLAEFGRLATRHGIIEAFELPLVVQPAYASST
jgi:chorismate dehydratase